MDLDESSQELKIEIKIRRTKLLTFFFLFAEMIIVLKKILH